MTPRWAILFVSWHDSRTCTQPVIILLLLFTQSHCDLSSPQLLLFFTTISVTSLGFFVVSCVFLFLFLPSFHWLDHVAAVWFRIVTRMYEPGDCIRVSRVKYLCSTTSSTSSAVLVLHGTTCSTQAIQVHLRQNSVRRSMYAVLWIYHCSQVRQERLPYCAFTFDTHFSCRCTSAVFDCTIRPSHSTFPKDLYQASGLSRTLVFCVDAGHLGNLALFVSSTVSSCCA